MKPKKTPNYDPTIHYLQKILPSNIMIQPD